MDHFSEGIMEEIAFSLSLSGSVGSICTTDCEGDEVREEGACAY